MQLMLIAPRFDYDVHEFLDRKFSGDEQVVVIRERRVGPRRRRPQMRERDRRRQDRRGRFRGATGVLVALKPPR